MSKENFNFFWFRRDLRLNDNIALHAALADGAPVQCVFIFDTNILSRLSDKHDARVNFIYSEVLSLHEQLQEYGSGLMIEHGEPIKIWETLLSKHPPGKLFFNRDYEPYALRRDEAVTKLCESSGVVVSTFKDHVLFEPWEVLKKDGGPYTVFTPYKNAFVKILEEDTSAIRPKTGIKGTFSEIKSLPVPDLKKLGFLTSKISYPARKIPPEVLDSYAEKRDFPGISGTSKLSIHLRFGTVSIREIASLARKQNSDTFFSELIWRDFYQMILWHFPHVTNHAFKPAYDRIKWRNNTSEFEAWCQGNTGYPIVDAGMRELNTTGFMHNRIRMVTASFLVKHLLIDWRWGEAYFAEKLLDFELASNNGGWQWAAGSGCDATPYFRIFNPYTQAKKFDPHLTYIRKWIPELDTSQYPEPIVEHMFARERCLRVYKAAVQNF